MLFVLTGSLLASVIPSLLGYQGPKQAGAGIQPALEKQRSKIRKQEELALNVHYAKEVVDVVTAEETAEETEYLDDILGAQDIPGALAHSGRTVPASVRLRAEEVWPDQKGILLTVGEEGILQALLNAGDRYHYGLVLRRIIWWQESRAAACRR